MVEDNAPEIAFGIFMIKGELLCMREREREREREILLHVTHADCMHALHFTLFKFTDYCPKVMQVCSHFLNFKVQTSTEY